jgi:hypothetical protein
MYLGKGPLVVGVRVGSGIGVRVDEGVGGMVQMWVGLVSNKVVVEEGWGEATVWNKLRHEQIGNNNIKIHSNAFLTIFPQNFIIG